MARTISVEIIGDSRSLERAFARSEKSAKGFNAQMTTVGSSMKSGAIAAGIAAATAGLYGLAKAGKAAVTAGSDLNEQMSKTQVVFGQSASAVVDWSKTTASAMGLSQRQALATASGFGALFAPLGIAGNQAAEQSRRLTQLGADLASFYNTDVQSALDAIRSGLVGEAEPLRRYGALLSEARVTQQALNETGKTTATQLTAQDKVLARISLIYRDTNKAQGDFSRTSGGLANQQRMLTAQLDDLQTTIGTALLPHVTEVATRMNKWLANTENKQMVIGTVTGLIDNLATAFGFLASAIGKAADAQDRLKDFKINLFHLVPGLRELSQASQILGLFGGGGGRNGDFGGPKGTDSGGGGNFTIPTPTTAGTSGGGRAGQTARDIAKLAQNATEQRNRWFDALIGRQLGRVGDIRALRGQIGRLNEIAAMVRDRIRITKDITRRLNLEDQLADVVQRRRGIEDVIADQARDAKKAATAARKAAAERRKALAEKAADARKAAAADAAEARRAAIDRRFGWLDFAIERAGATEGSGDNRRALNAKTRFLQQLIRHEGRTLELVSELWRTRQQIRDLNKKKMRDGDPLAGLMQVSSKRLANILAAGTGLSPAGMRVLGANISGAEIQPLHIHVNVDGREIGRAVTKDQARGSRRTANQTSGFRGA